MNFNLGDSCLISKRFSTEPVFSFNVFKPWRAGTIIAVGNSCVRVQFRNRAWFKNKIWIHLDNPLIEVSKVQEI
jgi:hypothetical protein